MWFKNIKIYRLPEDFTIDTAQLQLQLEAMSFKACQSQEIHSMGWVSPIPQTDSLFQQANQDILFKLKRESKLLPASVINDELNLKVGEFESESGSPMPKKAQKDLKEEITNRLLPQAFSKYSHINGFVSLDKKLVIIDASSDANAEVFLACLRKCLGSLPALPLAKASQQHILTDWLMKDCPADVELLDEAEFQSSADNGGTIKVKKQNLDEDEVLAHIQAGKLVQKLAIAFSDRLTAIIEHDLSVKRIKFTDIVIEQNEDIPKGDVAVKLDADFVLFASEIKSFIAKLENAFELNE
ncbi:recombination-associated protein RdgC [Glaciecola petra]|uniref:Recombination-associated protein RdgC n=1 Tax=Glaciecola petra TaxID=3075602 RepID=A0ABU2ZMD7_9ALTE|nr:recombination-associated protein RdgC [Aestuariibacter sp. P117]MDT0593411.1 recombination-associated protein RdgC [Aestuariibacter sp. P117]